MDEVWQLVYKSFEESAGTALRSISAMNGGRNELQFSLQKAISSYKSQPTHDKLDQIAGDVKTANAMGYVSNETAEKIMNILDKEGM
jgi:hypothetical protein